MLKTEQDTPEMRKVIENLAQPHTYFEHGQWWVRIERGDGNSHVFSVVDTSYGLELEYLG